MIDFGTFSFNGSEEHIQLKDHFIHSTIPSTSIIDDPWQRFVRMIPVEHFQEAVICTISFA